MVLKFSFLIAAWHEEQYIGECIEYIQRLNYPKNKVEIIVACDSDTAKIARKYSVRVIEEKERGGKWKALTNMFQYAKGDIIVVNDAENFIYPPDALKMLEGYFKNPKVGGVSFTTIISSQEIKQSIWVLTEYIVYIITRYYQALHFPVKSFKDANFPIITNSFRNVIKSIETINDDGEVSYYLLKKGYWLDFSFDVMWYGKGSTATKLSDIMKQKVRTNMGWDQLKKKYGLNFQSFYVDLAITSFKAMFTLAIFILGYFYSMLRGKFWSFMGKKSPEKVWKKIERY